MPHDSPRPPEPVRLPRGLRPMLASSGPLPEDDGRWAYEVKWDGVRALVGIEDGRLSVTSRNGNDVSAGYPELAGLAEQLGRRQVLLDGEIVAFNAQGRTDFGLLQSRMHVRGPSPALRRSTPVQLLVFDLLHQDGTSLLDVPYCERRDALDELDLAGPHWQVPAAFTTGGQALLDATRAQGLEGIVAKRCDSRYEPARRSDCWRKLKHVRRTSAVIVGWKPGDGGRSGKLGSLVLGLHGEQGLEYAGHVGTGFTAATLASLGRQLEALPPGDGPPFVAPLAREHSRFVHWVEPVLVCEVEYTAMTKDGRLRHPSYKGLRNDVPPQEVMRE